MKIFILICAAFLLTNCTLRSFADGGSDSKTASTPVLLNVNSSNVNNALLNRVIDASTLVDKDNLAESEKQNEKFRTIPEEFKKIDFQNFVYPANGSSIKLKNGEREFFQDKNWGNGWLTFNDNFFIELTGDDKNEAVIILSEGHCGGSCDGGAADIYFYSLNKNRPNLLGVIATGSHSGGCYPKSLVIKNKRILLQQFGKCVKNSDTDENDYYSCKFCVKGETHSVYKIENSKLIKESSKFSDTPEYDVMNFQFEVTISD